MNRPHQRSDPKKLQADREAIGKSMEEFKKQNPTPTLVTPKKNVFQKFGDMMDEAREQRRLKKNPPPRIEGAQVTGFKRPRNDA